MKLALVGTRNTGVTYQEWEKLLLNKINPDEIQIVISGGAKGVDTFVKLFAARHHKPYIEGTHHSIKKAQRLSRRVIVVPL